MITLIFFVDSVEPPSSILFELLWFNFLSGERGWANWLFTQFYIFYVRNITLMYVMHWCMCTFVLFWLDETFLLLLCKYYHIAYKHTGTLTFKRILKDILIALGYSKIIWSFNNLEPRALICCLKGPYICFPPCSTILTNSWIDYVHWTYSFMYT